MFLKTFERHFVDFFLKKLMKEVNYVHFIFVLNDVKIIIKTLKLKQVVYYIKTTDSNSLKII